MKNRLLIYLSVLIGLISLFIYNCKKDDSNTTDKSTGFCLTSAPVKDSVLSRLKTFEFDEKDTSSLAEAEKILKFLCPDASIHYPSKLTVCGKFKSGYHLTLWADAYGKKDRYSARYGTEEDHSFFGSNDTYFEIIKPVGFTATTNSATSVTLNGAILNGTVNANNQITTVTFEYGTSSIYGHNINAAPNIVNGSINTDVSASLTGLSANTIYHFRVKAVNSTGTTYGSDITLTTTNTSNGGITFNPNLTYGSVSDNDGNTYKTIVIGTQTWMAENLRTTKYRDGSAIPNITGEDEWNAQTEGAYCWNENDASNKSSYGALYNYYVITDNHNICPVGWHVPTDAEWTTLVNYLGGSAVAGDKLKETGTEHWLTPNIDANNSSGFTALAGGSRGASGFFYITQSCGSWLSSTEYNTGHAWYIYMCYNDKPVYRDYINDESGFSVRCMKDQ